MTLKAVWIALIALVSIIIECVGGQSFERGIEGFTSRNWFRELQQQTVDSNRSMPETLHLPFPEDQLGQSVRDTTSRATQVATANHTMEDGMICGPDFLPIFWDMESLKPTVWYKYLDRVYGADTLEFPIDLNRFTVFYLSFIPPCIVSYIKSLYPGGNIPQSPSKLDEFHYFQDSVYGGQQFLWRYPYPYIAEGNVDPPFLYQKGFPNYTLVEVTHMCCDNDTGGFWMYHTRGSGIFYNLGRSIVFENHPSAYHYFCGQWLGFVSGYLLRRMRKVAIEQGWDSIQYLYTREYIFKLEFEDLRIEEERTCPEEPWPKLITRGWNGKLPCQCSNGNHVLNCKGLNV